MNTKDRIIQTALKQALLNGYRATSLNTIAAEVGVSKPALYHHFPSKTALFREVIEYFFSLMQQWSRQYNADVSSFREFLERQLASMHTSAGFMRDVLGADAAISPFAVMELFLEAGKADPQIIARMAAGYEMTRTNFTHYIQSEQQAGVIDAAVDAQAMSMLLLALIEGLGLQARFDPTLDMQARGQAIVNQLWNWITKEKQ
jgi:AcrR family transcriptional regulator